MKTKQLTQDWKKLEPGDRAFDQREGVKVLRAQSQQVPVGAGQRRFGMIAVHERKAKYYGNCPRRLP